MRTPLNVQHLKVICWSLQINCINNSRIKMNNRINKQLLLRNLHFLRKQLSPMQQPQNLALRQELLLLEIQKLRLVNHRAKNMWIIFLLPSCLIHSMRKLNVLRVWMIILLNYNCIKLKCQHKIRRKNLFWKILLFHLLNKKPLNHLVLVKLCPQEKIHDIIQSTKKIEKVHKFWSRRARQSCQKSQPIMMNLLLKVYQMKIKLTKFQLQRVLCKVSFFPRRGSLWLRQV